MKWYRRILSLPLLATLLLTGCGGGNNGQSGQITVTSFKGASTVIGQTTFSSYSSVNGSTGTVRSVAAYTTDGSYGSPLLYNGVLYVSDFNTNRILGFNTVPAANGTSADFVVGQSDFASTGPGTTASTFNGPESVRYSNGKFFVLDYYNSRVLIWNSPPTTGGVPADVVVGQPGFMTGDCVTSNAGLCNPDDIFVVGNKLIVSDSGNNRVMIWNSIPTTNGAAADLVLGQGDFDSSTANDDNGDGVPDSAPSSRTLSYPAGLWSNGNNLILCDTSNNRVLIWNSFPTNSFAAANYVLGQSDFSHTTSNDDNQDGSPDVSASARTFDYPYYVTSNGTVLFVSDANNNRVLVWDTIPTSSFAAANKVLGQAALTANVSNDDNQDGSSETTPSARTLDYPTGLSIFGNKLFVTDYDNYRVLTFNF